MQVVEVFATYFFICCFCQYGLVYLKALLTYLHCLQSVEGVIKWIYRQCSPISVFVLIFNGNIALLSLSNVL